MSCLAKRVFFLTGFGFLMFYLASLPSLASDPPDSELNPMSGFIETTDAVWQTDNYNVRHVINLGNGYKRETFMVTIDSLDEVGSRLAITDDGNSAVTWWRDSEIDKVLMRIRTYSSGEWTPVKLISESTESSRNPEIVFDGTAIWVAYEFDYSNETAVGVQIINDDPNPLGSRAIVTTTDYAGDLDTMIHEEAGHLWISWVDSGTEVGWSEYDYGTEEWDTESYEWYADDSVEAARERISATIIGQ